MHFSSHVAEVTKKTRNLFLTKMFKSVKFSKAVKDVLPLA